MPSLIDAVAFRNPARAGANLDHLPVEVRSLLGEQVERMLQSSPDPDGALDRLTTLAIRNPDSFRRLLESPTSLKYLVAVFSHSRFLSDEVLQYPEWIEEADSAPDLFRVRRRDEFQAELSSFVHERAGEPLELSLSLFRRKQLLRILVRDVLGFATLPEITEELSSLAASIVDAAYSSIRADLMARYGRPLSAEGTETGFSVIGLGKLGGEELNYSSDIDLMFVYSENGDTSGPSCISNREFYKKLSNQITEMLSAYTAKGACYRVDLRLRPEGRYGEVCISVEGARQYYRSRARDWELQMLIKSRVVAGDPGPGTDLLDSVEPLIYSSTLDFTAVESMSEARERISEKLTSRRGGGHPGSAFDIKLAPGGIRDIEFLVQCLQRLHGGREPWVRHGGTMLALSRLHDKQLLSENEYWRLSEAYQFLRDIEHRLQCVDDRQTHTLPSNPEEFELLARRLPATVLGPARTGELLRRQVNERLEDVLEIYERVIHAQKPMYYAAPVSEAHGREHEPEALRPLAPDEPAVTSNLIRFLDQKAPNFAAVIAEKRIRRCARNLEHFLERIVSRQEWMDQLDSDPVLASRLLDLFEHSRYFGEAFIRFPELMAELTQAEAGRTRDYVNLVREIADPAELRRSFRREMTRLQCESVCLCTPVFDTLARTSDLADAVISAAYRIAVQQSIASKPPRTPEYEVRDQLMLIALGRLGQREFDLASDADLVFAIPDEDSSETVFWTRVAERTIDLITAYTGDGIMFAVDTRLRPNGREGPLVQTISGFKDYFDSKAEAWEGIAYMKSRAVAGDLAAATDFLNQLQTVDWRRWGQSGRSRPDLRAMRARLEKEQGRSNPLKAGRGGYYDIDFALMYLRLKSAGMFFKVLNTPERIDVIERMGHLDRADADFLRDAAVFYRAVDHGLRIFSGQADGDVPTSEFKVENLTELVRRWTPDRLQRQPLHTQLDEIRDRTREFFERIFT